MFLQLAKNLVESALDWLLPPLCPATGQPVDAHGTLDPEYWKTLHFITPPYCAQCALPFPSSVGGEVAGLICGACLDHPPRFRKSRAALVYDDASRKLILRFKNGDQLQAIRTLVPWLREAGGDILRDADVLVPVPLHRWKLLKRRYNQSALLAQGVGQALGKPVYADGLMRIKATPPQGYLSRSKRADNVRGVFRANGRRDFAGKAVVLIDDVMTTGATASECADALLAAGAASVDVVSIARVAKEA